MLFALQSRDTSATNMDEDVDIKPSAELSENTVRLFSGKRRTQLTFSAGTCRTKSRGTGLGGCETVSARHRWLRRQAVSFHASLIERMWES